eukprot:CAMPEP_0114228412 /NCGR_PEP_ID=MMETSP0058-20121206/2327_1 /TAXON_ID=36894 /ORGANISM="Pyramimonas parkeae, CCMP726" /LENGTH=567 /DNA_ID=CAMNT_0001339353 /DNA_START=154 /DNA_END=1857 /DNA_ORIENTATION=+
MTSFSEHGYASEEPLSVSAGVSALSYNKHVVTVEWTQGTQTTTNPTYQTSVNPKYREDALGKSNISDKVFKVMSELSADYVRHAPWFPYPHLAVAELRQPVVNVSHCETFWDFTFIDPITEAFLDATYGHPVVLNFATVPQFMWETPTPVSVPADPNRRDLEYEQGSKLRDPTRKEMVGYFTRLASYYTNGGFFDECGSFVRSPYRYRFAWWEVFNEPDAEHHQSIQEYTKSFDAIVGALSSLMPDTKFLGMSLQYHYEYDAFRYFLNSSNHNLTALASKGSYDPDAPLVQGISYHQYPKGSGSSLAKLSQDYFSAQDAFVDEVKNIEQIRNAFSPRTATFINEVGCALSNITQVLEPGFFTMCAASFAYLYGRLAPLGIDHLGMSQVIGFTGATLGPGYEDEWPSTTMVNWWTGDGNVRYWVLKLLIDNFAGESVNKTAHVTSTRSMGSMEQQKGILAQAFTVHLQNGDKRHTILLVNTLNKNATVEIPHARPGDFVNYVDETTGQPSGGYPYPDRPSFGCNQDCIGHKVLTEAELVINMKRFATAIVVLQEPWGKLDTESGTAVI